MQTREFLLQVLIQHNLLLRSLAIAGQTGTSELMDILKEPRDSVKEQTVIMKEVHRAGGSSRERFANRFRTLGYSPECKERRQWSGATIYGRPQIRFSPLLALS